MSDIRGIMDRGCDNTRVKSVIKYLYFSQLLIYTQIFTQWLTLYDSNIFTHVYMYKYTRGTAGPASRKCLMPHCGHASGNVCDYPMTS